MTTSGDDAGLREFARAVAHDLNNLLTVLAGYPELMLLRTDLDAEVRKRLETMLRASERATEYVGQLGALGGRMPLKPGAADPVEVTREAAAAAQGPGPRCEVEAPAGLDPVRTDPARLAKALGELVALLRERNPKLERVRLTVGRTGLGVEWVAHDPTPLDDEARRRALLPFGLKRADRARGLALAATAEFARTAGGELRVDPEPPGVAWRLTLPG